VSSFDAFANYVHALVFDNKVRTGSYTRSNLFFATRKKGINNLTLIKKPQCLNLTSDSPVTSFEIIVISFEGIVVWNAVYIFVNISKC